MMNKRIAGLLAIIGCAWALCVGAEHRAQPNMDPEQSSKAQHRIPEGYVIALSLKNGFVLAGVAEINASTR